MYVELLEKEGMKDLYIYIYDTIYPLEKSYMHSSVGGMVVVTSKKDRLEVERLYAACLLLLLSCPFAR
jgi:hypothetical protein